MVGDRLQDELRANESFVPIIGDEKALCQLAQPLPGGFFFPMMALAGAELAAWKRVGELARAVGGELHAAELVRGLEGGGVGDVAGGGELLDIGREHLQAVAEIAAGGENFGQQIDGFGAERGVGILGGEFRQQAVNIGFLLVLHHGVFAVGHLVGVAEGVPVRHGERHGIAVAFQPDIAVDIRAHFQRRGQADGVVHVVRDDFIFVGLAAERAEARPGFGFRAAGLDDVGLFGHCFSPVFVSGAVIPVIFRDGGADAAGEGRHFDLQAAEFVVPAEMFDHRFAAEGAVMVGMDADIVAAVDDEDGFAGFAAGIR